MCTLLVLKRLVTELWVSASSVQKECGEAPSQTHLLAEHAAYLEEFPGAPVPLCAYISVLCLLPRPSMKSCGTG